MLIDFCKREGKQINKLTETNRIRYYLKGKQVIKKEYYLISSATIIVSRKLNDELHSKRTVEPYLFFLPLPLIIQKQKQQQKRK